MADFVRLGATVVRVAGDRRATALAGARAVGVSDMHAEVGREDKASLVAACWAP